MHKKKKNDDGKFELRTRIEKTVKKSPIQKDDIDFTKSAIDPFTKAACIAFKQKMGLNRLFLVGFRDDTTTGQTEATMFGGSPETYTEVTQLIASEVLRMAGGEWGFMGRFGGDMDNGGRRGPKKKRIL